MSPKVIVLLCGMLLSTGSAVAEVFNVEAGDVLGLAQAIDAANTNEEADSIVLEAGDFTLINSYIDGKYLVDGEYFARISSEISISGAVDATSLIQRPSSEYRFSFFLVEETGTLTLSNLTISGGGGVNGCGGAMTALNGGHLIIEDSELSDNSSQFSGGALCNLGGNTVIRNSVFRGNYAKNSGGAIYNTRSITHSSTLEIVGSFFIGNEAGNGGALDNDDGEMNITASMIMSNTARGSGGGISVAHSGNASRIKISIQDSTIQFNSATGDGGGLDLHSSNTTISGSTISHNSAGRNGGGIQAAFGLLISINSTISGNSAGGRGGGIESLYGFSDVNQRVDMNNTTITSNKSTGEGGGIYNNKYFRILNSIVAGNSDANGPSDCVGSMVSVGYNLVQAVSGNCGLNAQKDIVGESPLLGPLADNGGLTRTHALMAGSPAIDAGNPEPPGSSYSSCELTDQRGALRNCDIGAFEFDSEPPAIPFRIDTTLSGAWFNPETTGQGLLIDVVPHDQFMFLAWFTFTDGASPYPGEQHWFTAQGNYFGTSAKLILYETTGGEFNGPQETSTTPVGTVTLSFDDCEQGQMVYHIDSDGRSGMIPLQRAIPGSGDDCKNLGGNEVAATETGDINAGMSGAWVNNETLGQGFLIDAYPNPQGGNHIFVAWFTYGDDTFSGQRWLTAQGSFEGSIAEIGVFETTGGRFDDPQVPSTTKVGTMSIDFTDCNNAQLTYSLPSDGTGSALAITRAIPGGEAYCEELVDSD